MTQARRSTGPTAADGLVLVDKPAGWTSHDVVARLRRLARTKKVGHAGTLDPMATGVLVIGIGRATRLLGHLALSAKSYDATIRLGVTTSTDDAEGEVLATHPASATDAEIAAAVATLTGEIDQVPSSVSAIKVDGVRSYARVRAGEAVELAARPVRVSRFDVLARRDTGDGPVDLDVTVDCSSGTYIRALARDLGAALGCGGHLTALRRTRVGPFALDAARTLDELAAEVAPAAPAPDAGDTDGAPGPAAAAGRPVAAEGGVGRALRVVPLATAVATAFPRRDVDADAARSVSHGGRLAPFGLAGPYGVFDPDGAVLALAEDRDGAARSLVVFAPA